MSIGRNAPCPCGSGLKYKRCCLKKEQPATRAVSRLSSTLNEVNGLLVKHAGRIHGDRIFSVFEEHIGVGSFHDSPYLQLFVPWFLYFWTVEEEAGFPWSIEETVAARFLKERRSRATRASREVIESGREEPFTFWQVLEVEPEIGMGLRDFVTGREVFAREALATRGLVRWDILFCRVVEWGDECVIDGMGPIVLSPDRFREEVESLAQSLRDEAGAPHALLCLQAEVLRLYMDMAHRTEERLVPRLQNTDGDKLVFVESMFTFDPSLRSDVLKVLEGLRNIYPVDGEMGETAFVWEVSRRDNPAGISKGRILVTGEKLCIECNSRSRDRQLRKRIEKHLSHLVRHVETTYEDVDLDALEEDEYDESEGDFDLDALPEEARREIEATVESVHLSWADQNVPALSNRTPRGLMETPDGRGRVAAMINDFENRETRNPASNVQFDYDKLRKTLGLPLGQIAGPKKQPDEGGAQWTLKP